jgi:Vacuolar protein sorting-associated protein 62
MATAHAQPRPDAQLDEKLELLERHKPVLRFDRQYDYRLASVQGVVDNPGNLLMTRYGEVIARAGGDPALTLGLLSAYPDEREPSKDDQLRFAPNVLGDARAMEGRGEHGARLYGRVCEDGARTWLQYWFWLYYNPKNLFGFGKHEGDWEMIQIGLDAGGEPELIGYAQHDSGESRKPHQMEWVERDGGRHAVVYISPYSHASYFEAGTHPYPVGIDHPLGEGPEAWLSVEHFGEWVKWPGRWGSCERAIAKRIGNGPPSPSQQGTKWTSPASFQRKLRLLWLRAKLGQLMHFAGRLSFPQPPALAAHLEGRRCVVDYETPGRRSRHLYLTVHDGERVVASRTVRCAGEGGQEIIRLDGELHEPAVCGSTFNRLRQRSDVVETVP